MKYPKLNCLLLLVLWQFIFLAKPGDGQFHWGKSNNRGDDLALKLLEAFSNMGVKNMPDARRVSRIK